MSSHDSRLCQSSESPELRDLYDTARSSIGLPVGIDSIAVKMYRPKNTRKAYISHGSNYGGTVTTMHRGGGQSYAVGCNEAGLR